MYRKKNRFLPANGVPHGRAHARERTDASPLAACPRNKKTPSSTETPEGRGPSRTGATGPRVMNQEKTRTKNNRNKTKTTFLPSRLGQKPSKLLAWGDSNCEPLGAKDTYSNQLSYLSSISKNMWHWLYYVPFGIMFKIYCCKHRECFQAICCLKRTWHLWKVQYMLEWKLHRAI
jgi:hypothetical protein